MSATMPKASPPLAFSSPAQPLPGASPAASEFSFAYSMNQAEVTLTNCDREPVHVPGCIQPFGILLAVDPADLRVLQVSANAGAWLGRTTDALLATAVGDLFGAAHARNLTRMLAEQQLESLPRYLFTVSSAGGRPLDVLGHLHAGMLILEAEEAGLSPEDTASPETACEGRAPQDKTDSPYLAVNRITARLLGQAGLHPFCQTLAEEIRGLTGLDRVMIYRFQEDLSGQVFAEAKRDDLHSYLNLRYPAEDIPAPAREIFRRIWVRPVPAVTHDAVEIVPLLNPLSGQPLDLTYAFLRGASVMYTDYLKNMGVAMALTLSIVVEGKLWGLVACHHYAPKTVPWPVRAACELLAQIASLQLRLAEQVEFSDYRARMEKASARLVEEMLTDEKTLQQMDADAPELLDTLKADGIAIFEKDGWRLRGSTPTAREMQALLGWLREQSELLPVGAEILHTHALSEQFPPAAVYASIASGMLAMPVSRQWDRIVFWFRRELVQTVTWAGDPHSKHLVEGPGGSRLMPRASFALWRESVHRQAAHWHPVEIESARRLRLAVMEVVVARSERVSQLNHELAVSNAELDAFAYVTSHDLREPLRGIYHYAYYLREDAETRTDAESLLRIDRLLRLTKRMDGLIESLLHFSRVGRTQLAYEPLDMAQLGEEVVDIVGATRAEKKARITLTPPMPPVMGDAIRMRELLLNLVSNAVKYNDSATPSVEIGHADTARGPAYFVRDNGIGIAAENLDRIFDMFKRLHSKDAYGGGSGAGLSIVKKIVERHGGSIWVESEPGRGTTFYFTLGDNQP